MRAPPLNKQDARPAGPGSLDRVSRDDVARIDPPAAASFVFGQTFRSSTSFVLKNPGGSCLGLEKPLMGAASIDLDRSTCGTYPFGKINPSAIIKSHKNRVVATEVKKCPPKVAGIRSVVFSVLEISLCHMAIWSAPAEKPVHADGGLAPDSAGWGPIRLDNPVAKDPSYRSIPRSRCLGDVDRPKNRRAVRRPNDTKGLNLSGRTALKREGLQEHRWCSLDRGLPLPPSPCKLPASVFHISFNSSLTGRGSALIGHGTGRGRRILSRNP